MHLAAGLLCVLLLIKGVRTTADLEWPFDPDHFRDIAHAQTIRDGAWLQDPFYKGELTWYNPLLPGLLAAVSYLTGLPVHVAATRAGAFANIAAPLAFYWLVWRLAGGRAALAALIGFIFIVRAPTWAAPTYTPWLFGSVFAQPFFYLTLAEYYAALQTGGRWRFAGVGLLLGLTFLAHTAPAILAVAIIVIGSIYAAVVEKRGVRELARNFAPLAGSAFLIALPFLWSIVGHYRLRVRNAVPLIWLDPSLPSDNWRSLVTLIAQRPLLNSMMLLGLAGLFFDRVRRIAAWLIGGWLGASIVLFAYNNYLSPNLRGFGVPPLVPAHHFLLYERAAEIVLFGIGLSWAAILIGSAVARLLRRRGFGVATATIADGVLAALLAAIALWAYPAFAGRDDFGFERNISKSQFASAEQREVIPWIRANTAPDDVFLTSESAALSLVGPAGRKSVLPPKFFANPYVDWGARLAAHQAMWDALTSHECERFRDYARAYGVTFVMTVDSRTAPLQAGQCSLLPTRFPGVLLQIYRVSWR